MNVRAGEGYDEEDRLPWLETVEDDYREGPSIGRIVLLVVLVLLVLGAAGAAYYWYSQQRGQSGNGELIAAQEGDYKVKPDEPGGMKVEGEGDTVFSTSQGAASNSSINVGALPEAPVEGKAAVKAAGEPQGTRNAKLDVPVAGAVQPNAPVRTAAPVVGGGSGAVIQLGAFPDEGGANTAWARLSKRFGYLAPLGKSVERAEKDGKAIWRLRVNAGSNGQAKELCGRLKVAGESCYVAN